MARKVGQIIARGDRRWLIRAYLGRDHQTKKRKYHNRTIHGPMREAQAYLKRKLGERDLGRDLEGAKITLNEYLDRWLETAVKPRVQDRTCQDYEGMLQRYIRPHHSGIGWTARFQYQRDCSESWRKRWVFLTIFSKQGCHRARLDWQL
jgi:hypothetical protein